MSAKPKVYFACSIRAGRDDANVYKELVDIIGQHATVLTEPFADSALTSEGTNAPASEIHAADLALIHEADAVIAEVTTPSLGVGYEVAKAEEWGKPVLALFRESSGKSLSAMIAGSPLTRVLSYQTVSEVAPSIFGFLYRVAGRGPFEISKRYAAGQLTRDEVVSLLGQWEYAPEPAYDRIDGLPLDSEAGTTWNSTVGRALDQKLIDETIYDAALELHSSVSKPFSRAEVETSSIKVLEVIHEGFQTAAVQIQPRIIDPQEPPRPPRAAEAHDDRTGGEHGSVLLVGEPLTVYAQPELTNDDRESLNMRLPKAARDSLQRLSERRAMAKPLNSVNHESQQALLKLFSQDQMSDASNELEVILIADRLGLKKPSIEENVESLSLASTAQHTVNEQVIESLSMLRGAVQELIDGLGLTLVSAMLGVKEVESVAAWTKADGPIPNLSALPRIELGVRAWRLLSGMDGADTARAWFIGGNPLLNEATPITAIREGQKVAVLNAVAAVLVGEQDV